VPTAVIFDMDGVILDSERIIRDAWISTAAIYGYELKKDCFAKLIGGGKSAAVALLKEELGADFPFDETLPVVRAKIRKATQSGWPLKAGIRFLLNGLSNQTVPLAVATSTFKVEAESRLLSVGVDHYFDVICGGDEVAESKPSPEIFLLAAQRLKVSPSQCIVIEDSENGVLGAHLAGMRVVHIPDLAKPSDASRERAIKVFDSAMAGSDYIIRLAIRGV